MGIVEKRGLSSKIIMVKYWEESWDDEVCDGEGYKITKIEIWQKKLAVLKQKETMLVKSFRFWFFWYFHIMLIVLDRIVYGTVQLK